MKTKTIISTLILGFVFSALSAQVDEQKKYKMFCSALGNSSTSPNYIVVTVKSILTGETKEICTEAPFIEGAAGRENGDWTINCKKYKTRYFEFAKGNALRNIGFDLYTRT